MEKDGSMSEAEMIACLERQMALLPPTGFDLSSEEQFFSVGEWLLVFEGIYVANKVSVRPDRYPFQRHGSRSSTLLIL